MLLFIFLLFQQYYIPINKVDCLTQYGPCDEATLNMLNGLKGKRFMQVSKQLQKDFAYSEEFVRVERVYKFPAKIVVYLEQKKGEIAVKINKQNEFVILD